MNRNIKVFIGLLILINAWGKLLNYFFEPSVNTIVKKISFYEIGLNHGALFGSLFLLFVGLAVLKSSLSSSHVTIG